MSESIFQNSGCVNTILGSMIHLSSFLPVSFPILLNTTLNHKYDILSDVPPNPIPKMQYFGIGTKGCYCTSTGDSTHVKYSPDARNMDLYSPVPILVLTKEEDKSMSWEQKSQYLMRYVDPTDGYVKYFLKKIVWDPDTVQVIQIDPNGTESEYIFSDSYLVPDVSGAAQIGGAELTSSTRIIVRALGKCNVTYKELEKTMQLNDSNYLEISEFGFYSGCDVFLDEYGTVIEGEIPDGDDLIDGSERIEATYVQLAKHKTQLPVTLQNENSAIETIVSFESANSISI